MNNIPRGLGLYTVADYYPAGLGLRKQAGFWRGLANTGRALWNGTSDIVTGIGTLPGRIGGWLQQGDAWLGKKMGTITDQEYNEKMQRAAQWHNAMDTIANAPRMEYDLKPGESDAIYSAIEWVPGIVGTFFTGGLGAVGTTASGVSKAGQVVTAASKASKGISAASKLSNAVSRLTGIGKAAKPLSKTTKVVRGATNIGGLGNMFRPEQAAKAATAAVAANPYNTVNTAMNQAGRYSGSFRMGGQFPVHAGFNQPSIPMANYQSKYNPLARLNYNYN